MFVYVYSPSTLRNFFAQYVDSRLSRDEDWNLVSFWNADQLSRGQAEGFSEIHGYIMTSHCCATDESRRMVGIKASNLDDAWNLYAYDLWTLSVNPLRLVEDLESEILILYKLGCLVAVSILPLPSKGGLKFRTAFINEIGQTSLVMPSQLEEFCCDGLQDQG